VSRVVEGSETLTCTILWVCMCVYNIYTHTHTHTHTYVYICVHTHTHTHTQTHVNKRCACVHSLGLCVYVCVTAGQRDREPEISACSNCLSCVSVYMCVCVFPRQLSCLSCVCVCMCVCVHVCARRTEKHRAGDVGVLLFCFSLSSFLFFYCALVAGSTSTWRREVYKNVIHTQTHIVIIIYCFLN
jgi:hypothetical protein